MQCPTWNRFSLCSAADLLTVIYRKEAYDCFLVPNKPDTTWDSCQRHSNWRNRLQDHQNLQRNRFCFGEEDPWTPKIVLLSAKTESWCEMDSGIEVPAALTSFKNSNRLELALQIELWGDAFLIRVSLHGSKRRSLKKKKNVKNRLPVCRSRFHPALARLIVFYSNSCVNS